MPRPSHSGLAQAVAVAGIGFVVSFGACGLATPPAVATVFTVTSLADAVAADGECSLREALRAAHADLAVHECAAGGPEDTIVLAATGTYLFGNGEETFGAGELTVRGATGVPADHVVDLQLANRFLRVPGAGRLTLQGITLRGGSTSGLDEPQGGAVRVVQSELVLRDVAIVSCDAAIGGGGLWVVNLDAAVTLERVAFRDNQVIGTALVPDAGGGGFSIRTASARVVDVVADGNRAVAFGGRASGGGGEVLLDGDGVSVLRRLDVERNDAAGVLGDAAGLYLAAGAEASVTLEDSAFSDNELLDTPAGSAGVALLALAQQTAGLTVRRLDVASSAAPGAAAQVSVRAEGTSRVVVDALAVHHSPLAGLALAAADEGRLTAGQLTVTANGAGVAANGSSTFPVRLQNAILWGNGPGGSSEDLEVVGSVDAAPTVNRLWIGELGAPDPRFAGEWDLGLAADSGALDAGDATFGAVGPFDRVHAPRVVGSAMDLGAHERDGIFADDFASGDASAWGPPVS